MLNALHERLSSIASINGVSSNGDIDFAPQATDEQRAAAKAIVDSWNWERPELNSVALAKAHISNERYAKEISGISIEGQLVSSERDEIGHWYPRFANAYGFLNDDPFSKSANPTGQYPYKPKQGSPTILTAMQVVRAYQCLSWYVNMCFAVEKTLCDMLDAGTPIEVVLDAMPAAWPQREFMWSPPE
jgi:hypothetical protein